MILIDTDGGVDDALALAVALKFMKSTELIVTTVFGNVDVRQASYNMRYLADRFGADLHVLMGNSSAKDGFLHLANDVHGFDGLGGTVGVVPDEFAVPSAVEWISDRAMNETRPAEKFRILGIGPTTNLPQIVSCLGKENVVDVTLMSGAFFDRGNMPNGSEFNLFNDPISTRELLLSGVQINFVPLDICNKILLPRYNLPKLRVFDGLNEIIVKAHTYYMDFYFERERVDGCFPHDTIALLTMFFPERFSRNTLRFNLAVEGCERGVISVCGDGELSADVVLGGDLRWIRTFFEFGREYSALLPHA